MISSSHVALVCSNFFTGPTLPERSRESRRSLERDLFGNGKKSNGISEFINMIAIRGGMNVQTHAASHYSVVGSVEQVDMSDTKFGFPLISWRRV